MSSAGYAPLRVVLDGRTFVIFRGRSVVEVISPNRTKPVYGVLRRRVFAAV